MTPKKKVLVKSLIESIMNKDKQSASNALNSLINLRLASQIKKVNDNEKLI